ncbi:MAG: hypothetical protein JRJ35_19030 [Deltaproteobacteria bacterium]|nr:hypothetical protein [Deltaproteobacteria bacterium]MBW1925538.1 hypothetical protein [Deltaproteobacteria bacterium]MBW1951243.1 hypothetical protein [Deltaproteobacteria bacterium]MBW2009730.1 hypothetical protein [Deltaproteobacteria bacterium]MBW2101918.1 hypothetical protein [Deltaproteobacteria bacterium]
MLFFGRVCLDDPVSAVSVHGVHDAWGTQGAGIFSMGGTSPEIIGVQLPGITGRFVWVFVTSSIPSKVMDKVTGLRVSGEEAVRYDI